MLDGSIQGALVLYPGSICSQVRALLKFVPSAHSLLREGGKGHQCAFAVLNE